MYIYTVLLEDGRQLVEILAQEAKGATFLHTCTAVHLKLNLSNVTCNGREILCRNKQVSKYAM